jgi:hypothetical protein
MSKIKVELAMNLEKQLLLVDREIHLHSKERTNSYTQAYAKVSREGFLLCHEAENKEDYTEDGQKENNGYIEQFVKDAVES